MSDEVNHEQILRERYVERARSATPEELAGLIDEIMTDPHTNDYGGVGVAIGLIAAASAWAMNRHPGARGGITGFQGGAVLWEFVRHWDSGRIGEAGARIQSFDNLMFPQYADSFQTLPRSAVDAVQRMARERLETADRSQVHPEVIAHWETLAAGQSPYGMRVSED